MFPAFVAFLLMVAGTHAAVIAQWDFNSIEPDGNAATGALSPAEGAGTAALAGGVTSSFTASNGSSDPNADNSNWRITTWPTQGAQNKQNGVLTIVSYNVLGRDQPDWTTNSAQVRAIGRQLAFLEPDIVGFQEIPETNANYLQMSAWVTAYLPGYYLATGQRTDGGERSAVASRFPIARSRSWLARSSLAAFGYDGVFTRDLFEAEILVPGMPQPFHFFTTHLKAHPDQASSVRRAAEARAISNFFAIVYLPAKGLRPYVLVGDMNEDIARPRAYEQRAIQTLTSLPTGLWLTTPRNPATNDERTWSIQNSSLTIRFDYILPCGLFFSNIVSSQVFRSDKVVPPAPPLLASDSASAADHLPVVMVFRDPYDVPLSIRGLTITNQTVRLRWGAIPGDRYRVERSSDLAAWQPIARNLLAESPGMRFETLATGPTLFFRIARER